VHANGEPGWCKPRGSIETGSANKGGHQVEIDLRNKLALVTGGTGNIGRFIVRTLADCGASVVIHYLRNEAKAKELQAELKSKGVKCMTISADITKLDSMEKMRDAVIRELGAPDIVVTNAVIDIWPKWTTVLKQPVEDFVSQYESCVMQNVYAAKVFVPEMIKKRWGRIIGFNTECVLLNDPGTSAYTAGKKGMDGLLRVLAREVGEHGITVNEVAPGWTITDKTRAEGSERQEAYEKKVALKRRGTDQEIANVVAFLASDLASFITGAFIPVCGGIVMPGV